MGQHLVTHDPCDPSDFRDPFDPWPMTHRPIPCSALCHSWATCLFLKFLLRLYRVPRRTWLDAQCTPKPTKRVSVVPVSRFLACDFIPRVNHPHLYLQNLLFGSTSSLSQWRTLSQFLTTDKNIITKLEQTYKMLHKLLNFGVKGSVAYVMWPTFKFWDPLYI